MEIFGNYQQKIANLFFVVSTVDYSGNNFRHKYKIRCTVHANAYDLTILLFM